MTLVKSLLPTFLLRGVAVELLSWLLTLLLSELFSSSGSLLPDRILQYCTFLLMGVAVELLSWLLTLLLSELFSSSGSLLPDRTPRTSGRPELCRILIRKNIVK